MSYQRFYYSAAFASLRPYFLLKRSTRPSACVNFDVQCRMDVSQKLLRHGWLGMYYRLPIQLFLVKFLLNLTRIWNQLLNPWILLGGNLDGCFLSWFFAPLPCSICWTRVDLSIYNINILTCFSQGCNYLFRFLVQFFTKGDILKFFEKLLIVFCFYAKSETSCSIF